MEAPDSNLDRDADYRKSFFFVVFPQVFQADAGIVLYLGQNRFLPYPFQFIIHQHCIIPLCITRDTDSVVKWTANE